jgi:hypothetical protein
LEVSLEKRLRGELAVAFEESDGTYEETACGESHQNDRMTIGGLGSGWGGGGVVLALGAALGVRGLRGHNRTGEKSECKKRFSRCRSATWIRQRGGKRNGFLHYAALRSK